jgi:flagellar biosynthesis protein FliQ
MNPSLVISALQLVAYLGFLLLGSMAVGGGLASILRVVTQIDDPSIGFIGRAIGLGLLLWVSSGYLSSEILEFTVRIWNGSDFYR